MKNGIYANFPSHPYSEVAVVMQTFEQGDNYITLSCELYVNICYE